MPVSGNQLTASANARQERVGESLTEPNISSEERSIQAAIQASLASNLDDEERQIQAAIAMSLENQ